MPSTTSSSVSAVFASSTVITPSLPTFCIALAIICPIEVSPFEAMVAIWPISSDEPTFFERFSMSLTTAVTARSMPRFRSIGFMPAATSLIPSFMIEAASTVAVVVPSPARSFVFDATSRTICAPMFSNLSSSSISLATVTPSLVMRGAPKLLSSTTLRPFGPSVTFTALARISTPRNILSRASDLNFTSLAAIYLLLQPASPGDLRDQLGSLLRLGLGLDHPHHIGLLHDQQVLAVEPDLGARPFAEQDPIADPDVERLQLATVVARAGAGGEDLAFLRLLLGGVGDDDAAG